MASEGSFGCCLYGPYTLLPAAFLTCSVITTWIVTFDCRFFASTEKIPNRDDFSYTVGPWLVEQWSVDGNPNYKPGDGWDNLLSWSTGDCVTWSEHNFLSRDDFDWPIYTTRTVTMLTTIAALFVAMVHSFTFCFTFPRVFIYVLGGTYITLGIVIGVSVVFPRTKFCQDAQHCSLRADAYILLASIGLWILAGVTTLFLPSPKDWVMGGKRPEPKDVGDTRETREEVEQEDGTIVIVTTVTTLYKNGDQNIIETRELKPMASSVLASSKEEEGGEEEEAGADKSGDEEEAPAAGDNGEGETAAEDEGNTSEEAAT